ncbi:MAG: hypothetical protein ACOH2H_25420 [Cypionkella sp.]
MRQNPATMKASAEQVVKYIRYALPKLNASDGFSRIVLSHLRGAESKGES